METLYISDHYILQLMEKPMPAGIWHAYIPYCLAITGMPPSEYKPSPHFRVNFLHGGCLPLIFFALEIYSIAIYYNVVRVPFRDNYTGYRE